MRTANPQAQHAIGPAIMSCVPAVSVRAARVVECRVASPLPPP